MLDQAIDRISELEALLATRDKELEEVRVKLEKMKVLRSAFYNFNDAFEWSEQPCKDFKPQRENNGYGEWDNRHECPGCCGLRSFCMNCIADHHENGWDNCAGRVKAQLAAWYKVFGTQQLTHAADRLEQAERQLAVLREDLQRAQTHNGELVADLMGCRDGALVRDLKARNARLEEAFIRVCEQRFHELGKEVRDARDLEQALADEKGEG